MVTHSWHIDLASVKAFEWLLSLSALFTILLFTRAKRELYSLYSAKMHKILTISSFVVERKEIVLARLVCSRTRTNYFH